jgi:beta-lactamase class C
VHIPLKFRTAVLAAAVAAALVAPVSVRASQAAPARVRRIVDAAIRPLMAKDRIPGMAIGITIAGRAYVFNYGDAAPRRPVTNGTLFEIGSVSKTFTATLASLAQIDGRLRLSATTSRYLPELRGVPFGNVTLLELGTHTPGGLPLQVPDDVQNDAQLIRYLKKWKPTYPPGTYRTYNNPGIGLLGLIAAKAMGQNFTAVMQQRVLPELGLGNTFYTVSRSRMNDYAEGHTAAGAPIRMRPAELWAQAYGVRTTAGDLIRFLQENMGEIRLDPKLQRALRQTHTAYFKAGPITQDLIWEQYPYPVTLQTLLQGNASQDVVFGATPAMRIEPPIPPAQHVWVNKTGSTNGFSTYVAFVPEKRLGIVVLANKSFAMSERITTAYRILTSLARRVDLLSLSGTRRL